jgi:N-acetylmuramoyl-L-alanine amidase
MLWRSQRAAAILGLLPAIAAANSGLIRVTGVRAWTHADVTRVIIETTGPSEYKSDRAQNPERLFFDVLQARPWIGKKRAAAVAVGGGLVRRVRVAETTPGTTRIVFDLAGPADFDVTRLVAPDRMVVELRPRPKPTVQAGMPPALPSALPISRPILLPFALRSASPSKLPIGRPAARAFVYPPQPAPVPRQIQMPPAPPVLAAAILPLPALYLQDPLQGLTIRPPAATALASRDASTPALSTRVLPAVRPAVFDAAPRPSADATRSLTRALGLKVNRIVIDAGHGGHDDGTIGPHGVVEKDVVLDIALRLSKLVQDRMGAEVILTRSDDTFIPLHERTAIANDHKSDLFLSIHANSSPAPEVAGTETFYLNFSSSPGAIDVAARENAGSDKNVGELKDLIQSITLNDKIEESRTFAQDVETSIQNQAVRSNAEAKNRGVKQAPFVVLIGASMPSILAEVGFLTNKRDESNLGKPEYRQKIAEALYKGLAHYSESLSHFEVARQVVKTEKSAERPIPTGLN